MCTSGGMRTRSQHHGRSTSCSRIDYLGLFHIVFNCHLFARSHTTRFATRKLEVYSTHGSACVLCIFRLLCFAAIFRTRPPKACQSRLGICRPSSCRCQFFMLIRLLHKTKCQTGRIDHKDAFYFSCSLAIKLASHVQNNDTTSLSLPWAGYIYASFHRTTSTSPRNTTIISNCSHTPSSGLS